MKNKIFNKNNFYLGAKFWLVDVVSSFATMLLGGLLLLIIFLFSLTGITILITLLFVGAMIVLFIFYLYMVGFLANKFWKIR
jgi:VIT1/CCC1 family predicted Fe2+/Mn2+ transporter